MKKRFTIHLLAIVALVCFSLTVTAEASGLEIKGKRFLKNGKLLYILTGSAKICNAEFIGKIETPWSKFGDSLNEEYKKKVRKFISAQKDKKIAVIQLFSAPLFQGQGTAVGATGMDRTVSRVNNAVKAAGKIKGSLKALASTMEAERQKAKKPVSTVKSWRTTVTVGDKKNEQESTETAGGTDKASSAEDAAGRVKTIRKSAGAASDISSSLKTIATGKVEEKVVPRATDSIWWDGDTETSWQRFISPEGVKMQRELIDFVISEAKKAGIDFTFSLMWESQTIKGRPEFLPWFKAHKEYIAKTYKIPVGIHSNFRDHIAAADFAVTKGGYAKDLNMFNVSKPVIVLPRDPGKFSLGNECSSYNDDWHAVAKQMQREMIQEFKVLGATGYPSKRWVNKKTMTKELAACPEKIKNYNFYGFAGKMDEFCERLREAAKSMTFDPGKLIEK